MMQFLEKLRKVWENRDIKLVTTEKRWNYLISKPNYQTAKFFTEQLLAIEMKKETEMLMNKPVYLWLSMLELIKILIYEFWTLQKMLKPISNNMNFQFPNQWN